MLRKITVMPYTTRGRLSLHNELQRPTLALMYTARLLAWSQEACDDCSGDVCRRSRLEECLSLHLLRSLCLTLT